MSTLCVRTVISSVRAFVYCSGIECRHSQTSRPARTSINAGVIDAARSILFCPIRPMSLGMWFPILIFLGVVFGGIFTARSASSSPARSVSFAVFCSLGRIVFDIFHRKIILSLAYVIFLLYLCTRKGFIAHVCADFNLSAASDSVKKRRHN